MIGLRRSGLSEPYHFIDCANVRRSKPLCSSVWPKSLVKVCTPSIGDTGLPSPNSVNRPCISGSIAWKTSSWVTKLISTSSW
ncbi:hypothetical protein D3C77_447320 [compost metagenome]